MAATKRNFILSSGIGLSADNIYTIGSTNSTSIGSGAVIVAGGVGIGQSASIGGRLQMFNGANYTSFVSSASGNTVYTLPATSPATGSSVLQSTSAGVLSWVPMTVTGGSAGGAGTVYDGSLNSIPYYPTAGTAITGSSNFTNTGTSINVGYTTAATNSSSGALTIVGGVGIGGSLYVAGDLTINGTTTTINSVTLTVDDKNIELGSVVTPSDVTAEGGGITLRGASDKSLNWYTGTGWSSSESFNLVSGSTYKINNTTVLSNSSIGTGVTNSSLTALGTITTGVWSGTSITAYYGGTGLQTTFTVGDLLYANTASTWNRLSPGTNGFILVSAGTANTPAYTNPATLTIGTATTATNINVVLAATNASHPLLFTPTSGSASGLAVSSNTTLVYNPSTDILSVSGAAITNTTASTSTTSGALNVTGGVGIGQSISVGGRLQMFNGANFTAFVSSASGNTVYTLPATSPGTGSSVLQSTSAGVMSWVAMTAGSASGNTSQNVVINTAGNANVFHPILFTPSSLSAGSAVSSDSTISFNPSTEILNVSGLAITSGTASTNTTTGALVVRGGLGVTGQLSFSTASFGFTGITTNPTMSFIGATSSSPITLTVLTDNSLNFEGSQGSVFSIDSNLSTGEIFSVSDISGLPIISASAGQTVTFNEFGGYTQFGNGTINSSSTSTGSVVIAGGLGMTGNAFIGGTTNVSNTTDSSTSTTGALTVSGGVGIGLSVSIGGRLQMFNGANFTSFVSSASGNTVYTLPATSPATGSSVLQSTSAGVMSWVPMAASSGAGSGTVAIPDAQYRLAYYAGTGASVSSLNLITAVGTGVTILGATNASSTTVAALSILGGLGVTGNAFIGGTASVTNTTVSTGTGSGALVVAGGAGIAGSLYTGTGFSSSISGVIFANGNASASTYNKLTITAPTSSSILTIVDGSTLITSGANSLTLTTTSSTNATFPSGTKTLVATDVSSLASLTTASSLNSVGIITSGTWSGTVITSLYGGTGFNSYTIGDILVASTGTSLAKLSAGSTNFVLTSNGTGTVPTWQSVPPAAASSVAVTPTTLNQSFFITTVNTSSGSGLGLSTITTFVINPSTEIVSLSGLAVTSGLNASSTTSAAFTVLGGLGITGNAFIGGTASITSNQVSISPSSGALVVTGGVGIGGSLYTSTGSSSSVSGVILANGNVSASTYNKLIISAPASSATLTIADGSTLITSGGHSLTLNTTAASNVTFPTAGTLTTQGNKLSVFASTTAAEFINVISGVTGTGNLVFATSPTFVTPVLGTPTSGNLASCTGYPIASVANLGVNVATFLADPTSAKLIDAVTGETGSGGLVFATSPVLVTPTLGAALATSINKVAFTAPATLATLTLADNSTLTTVGAFGLTLTTTATTNSTFPAGTKTLVPTDVTSLASLTTASSLNSIGTIATGVWAGTLITAYYGGTGYNTYTKGDVLVGAGNTFIRLGVGTDNFVLTASAASPAGVTWASPGAGSGTVAIPDAQYRLAYYAGTGASVSSINLITAVGTGVTILGATNASSTTVAALSILGGLGVTGNAFIGGTASITSSQVSISPSSGALVVTGGVGIGKTSYFGQSVFIQGATASTSSATGALTVAGGVGISGNLHVGTSFNDLYVNNFSLAGFAGSVAGEVKVSIRNTGDSPDSVSVLDFGNDSAPQLASFNLNSSTHNGGANHFSIYNSADIVYLSGTGKHAFDNQLTISGLGVSVYASTASISTTSGAFTVVGGVGIGGSIFGGSTISAADNIIIKSAKELRFNNTGNTFYTGFKAGANTSNATYTLPTAFPGTGSSVLQSDTSGTLTWVPMLASSGAGSGTVAIPDAQYRLAYYAGTGASVSSSNLITAVGTGVTILGETNASSTTVAALSILGGLGVTGNAFIGGTASVTSSQVSISSSSGALVVTGGVGIGGSLYTSAGSTSSVSGVLLQNGNVAASTYNKLTISAPAANATITIADTTTFATSGAYNLTLTTTAITNSTFPAGTKTLVPTDVTSLASLTTASSLNSIGTIATGVWAGTVIAPQYGGTGLNNSGQSGILKYTTGTGSLVAAPTGAIVGTTDTQSLTNKTYNNVTVTAPGSSATLTLANTSSLITSGGHSLTLTTTAASNVTFPTTGTLATTSNKLSDFAATTSLELWNTITGEVGSGALVFATSPDFTTSVATVSTTFGVFNTTATTINAFGAATVMSIGAATGKATFNSTDDSSSTTTGGLVVSGGAGIAKSVSIGGRLQLFNGAYYTALVSSASGNTVYTLPATSPATGTSYLTSNSSGVMAWTAPNKSNYVLSFGAGFTPTADSADSVSINIPYAPDGTTKYYFVKRIEYRNETLSGGTGLSFYLQRHTSGNALWATTNTITAGSGTSFEVGLSVYSASFTTINSSAGVAGSVISGNYLRLFFTTVGSAANVSIAMTIEEQ